MSDSVRRLKVLMNEQARLARLSVCKSGLIWDDGALGSVPISAEDALKRLETLQRKNKKWGFSYVPTRKLPELFMEWVQDEKAMLIGCYGDT